MIKTLATYLLAFGLLFFTGVYIHVCAFENKIHEVSFSITTVYLFHAVFSFLLCSVFRMLSNTAKWKDQLGFVYIGALVFKLVLFCVLFSSFLFGQEPFTYTERLSMLLPVVIFLLPEVYFIYKILMKLDSINN